MHAAFVAHEMWVLCLNQLVFINLSILRRMISVVSYLYSGKKAL